MKPDAQMNETARRLDWIRPRLPRALAHLHNWGGLGYGTGLSGGGRGSGTSNPTETVALSVAEKQLRDVFGGQYAEVMADVHTIYLATRRIEKAIQSTEATAEAAGATADGCYPCGQVREGSKPHENGWQPVRERKIIPTDPMGAKVPLCKFHADFLDRYEILPDASIDLWHLEHAGSRIPYQMIRDHHPDQFDRAQSKQRGRLLGRTNLDLGVEATA